MIPVTFRPLKVRPTSWRPPEATRKFSPFGSTYTDTTELLQKELRLIGAKSAFIQVELRDRDRGVRQDGQLRSGAVVDHPGVVLTIETARHGTLVYPCDAFRDHGGRTAWQENLRAIALGLEALRKVERYGIAERGQQYAGFAELTDGTPMGGGGGMTAERAAEFIVQEANRGFGDEWITVEALLDETEELLPGAYRDAARIHHPDAGGDPEMFRLLTEARDLLART